MPKNKIREAQKILKDLGLPAEQQNAMSALTLLALTSIGRGDDWKKAYRKSLTITKGIMTFIEKEYKKKYAPNTRETFRRHVLHQFVQAGIADFNPDNPELPTNSPNAHYAISEAALKAVFAYGTNEWKEACRNFKASKGSLLEIYSNKRESMLVPVTCANGRELKLSPGKHNELQAAVIKEFAPRFAKGARLLYLGDTIKKNLYLESGQLEKLNVSITEHDKLPDIILYDTTRNRLLLIEAVTSHGPVTPKRLVELKEMFSKCPLKTIFITAFPDFATFRKYIKEIAWETEVWIAEIPDHIIHYNGDKFLSL